MIYRSITVQIHSSHPLYPWCDRIAHYANNLYNAALFRERQLMTSSRKLPEEWTDYEREIREEVTSVIRKMNKPREIPASGIVSDSFMYDVMKSTRNPDYFIKGFPRHTARYVLKRVQKDFKSFFECVKRYKEDPSAFTGRPHLPRYKHKGGKCTFILSNQECVIKPDKNGGDMYYAKLPHTKIRLPIGRKVLGKLESVFVTPMNDVYQFSFSFGVDVQEVREKETPERICGIDLGVNNLMAVTNNCSLPSRL